MDRGMESGMMGVQGLGKVITMKAEVLGKVVVGCGKTHEER